MNKASGVSQIPKLGNTSLRKVFNLNPVAMLLIEPDQTIARANSTFCRLTGHDFRQLEARPIGAFPRIQEAFSQSPPTSPGDGHPEWKEIGIAHADGTVRSVRACLARIWDESDRLTHYLWLLEDIHEQRQAELEREAQQEQLRYLTQKVIAAQEEERRRIARELHDEWGQVLSSMKMDVRLIEGDPGETADRIDAKLDRLLASSRQLSRALRPSLLDQQGLAPALKNLANDFRPDFNIELQIPGIDRRFDEGVEITCFRLVQEGLTNIRRHSGAREVKICTDTLDGFLTISVIDDGQGFDPETVLAGAAARGSAGLFGMMERVRAQGGIYRIFSRRGFGTRVTARLPIDAGDVVSASAGSTRAEMEE